MISKMARLALLGAMVVAASSMAAAPKMNRRANGGTATTRPAQKQAAKIVRGEIASVDIETKTLHVEVKIKKELQSVEVLTNADTEFLLDGEVVKIVDLRPGMRVSFQPESGIATRVSAKTMSASEQKAFKEKKVQKALSTENSR